MVSGVISSIRILISSAKFYWVSLKILLDMFLILSVKLGSVVTDIFSISLACSFTIPLIFCLRALVMVP